MARGTDLREQEVREAINYNRRRLSSFLPAVEQALGLPQGRIVDEAFVRRVADWQEVHLGRNEGNGKVGPRTEAHLNIQHPAAQRAANFAMQIRNAGYILFDSWGNDVRDNDNDGVVDGPGEHATDGAHFSGNYASFRLKSGTYSGLGFERNGTFVVDHDQTVNGPFRYRVCADIVSQAFHDAGVMPRVRRTAAILNHFRSIGYVWQRSEFYPSEYLPGDFICVLGPRIEHSGIIVEQSSTSVVAKVVELPGPSTMMALGAYNPASTNDVRHGDWTKASIVQDPRCHYLGRLLYSTFPP